MRRLSAVALFFASDVCDAYDADSDSRDVCAYRWKNDHANVNSSTSIHGRVKITGIRHWDAHSRVFHRVYIDETLEPAFPTEKVIEMKRVINSFLTFASITRSTLR